MAVGRAALRKLLLKFGVSEQRTQESLDLAEPMFLAADNGYELFFAPTNFTNAEVTMALLSLFGEEEVDTVIVVSVSQPFPKQEWMSEAAYESTIRLMHAATEDIFEASVELVLADMLAQRYETELRPVLTAITWEILEESIEDVPGGKHWADVCTDALFYYFACLVAGKNFEILACKLEHLIKVMGKGWSRLARKTGEPKTWILFVP